MAKARKKGRRSGLNLNNNDNTRGDELARDNDFSMHGIDDSIDDLPLRCGRGGLHSSSTNSRRKNRQSRGGRKPKHGKLSFIDNPFENLRAIESLFPESDLSLGWQQPDDNQYNEFQGQGYDNNSHHHHTVQRGIPRRGGRWSRTPSPTTENHSSSLRSQPNQRSPRNNRRGGRSLPTPRPLSPSPQPSAPRSPSSSADETLHTRFCTECSTVRRANLTLRDWFSSGIVHASDVLDSWSDEVGVGRGSADEMDWQPEPVVRVLILPTTPSPTPTPSIASGSVVVAGVAGWQREPHKYSSNGAPGDGGKTGVVSANCSLGSPWGLRPCSIGPEFSVDGSVGEIGGKGGKGGRELPAPGHLSSPEDCVGQPINNCGTPWANAATLGSQGGWLTPPDTPPSSQS